MGIEVRAVNTGELCLPADNDTAATAHPGAVNHDGVEGDDGFDAVGAGDLCEELHHDVRPDGDDTVKLGAAFGDVLFDFGTEGIGGEALAAIGAVIGADDQLIGGGGELFLEDDDVGTAEAADEGDLNALFVHLFGDGVGNGAAYTATYNADLFEAFHLGGLAERTDNIGDDVALLHGVEHFCGAAGSLHHDGNRALLPVVSGDRNGNTLSLLIQAEDDELTRHCMARNERRFDFKKADCFCLIEESFGNDPVSHILSLPHFIVYYFFIVFGAVFAV